MVNLHNIHFPASSPLHLPVIPTAELCTADGCPGRPG